MAGDIIEIPFEQKALVYRVEGAYLKVGLRATVTVIRVETSTDEAGQPIRTTLHSDQINLDRDKARRQFAESAGVDAIDLLIVREQVLQWLSPPATDETAAADVLDDEERQQAKDFLVQPNLMNQVAETVQHLGYAGKVWLPQLIFLVMTSRLLRRPINLVVEGPSSAGKTFVVTLVSRLFPSSATYLLSGMSERVLAYTDAVLRYCMLIIGEASALHRDGVGASLLRSIAWERRIVYETVEKTADGLRPRRIEKEGPTGFITTTTGKVEAELETRTLAVHVPDDEATTLVILQASAARANGGTRDEPDLAPWQNAQRWLAVEGQREVSISFAVELAGLFPRKQVRARRDFTQLLSLIEAHALLHQCQRSRDDQDRIVADRRDYQGVYDLAAAVFGAIAAAGVTPVIRETVQAVSALVPNDQAASATVMKVAEALGVDKSVASRRISKCVKDGWLINEEERKGRPAKLRLGDALPEDTPALPHPDELFAPSPSDNRATVQPSAEKPSNQETNGGCDDRCRDAVTHATPSGERAAVAHANGVVQPPEQPQIWPTDATNGQRLHGCTVAQGETTTVKERVSI